MFQWPITFVLAYIIKKKKHACYTFHQTAWSQSIQVQPSVTAQSLRHQQQTRKTLTVSLQIVPVTQVEIGSSLLSALFPFKTVP